MQPYCFCILHLYSTAITWGHNHLGCTQAQTDQQKLIQIFFHDTTHRHIHNSAHIAHKKHICAGIRIMQTMVPARWGRKTACSCTEDRWSALSHNCTTTCQSKKGLNKIPGKSRNSCMFFYLKTSTRTVFSGITRASNTCWFWKTFLTFRRQVMADDYSHLHGRVGLSYKVNLAWQLKCWPCYTAPSMAAVNAGLMYTDQYHLNQHNQKNKCINEMEFAQGLQCRALFCTEQKMYLFISCHCQ